MRALLAACLLIAAAPASYADNVAAQVLHVHNRERAELGVPALTWNDALAADAQRWADHLASTGKFEHAGNDENPTSGENLAMGSSRYTAEQLAQLWADEKALFKYGAFPDVSTDGNWFNVGHYTQMIWKGTSALGCATAGANGSIFLVCRYDPPGNYSGQTPW
jgi:Cysteine-rich secretory protein family